MEMTMNMGTFEELDSNEMLAIDGGVNWWAAASAGLAVVAGALGFAASLLDPEPISKSLGLYSNYCWMASGVAAFIAAVVEE